jgi:carbamate kinase
MPSLKGNYLEPIDILEKSAIMNLMADGYLPLIFAPGAAVVKNLQYYSSVEGNVESNMYSSLLATLLEADTLIMITEAPLDSINPVHNSNGGMMKINYMELQKMYISGYYKNKDLSNIIKAVLSFITKGGSRSVIMPAGSIGSGIEIIK